MIVYDDDANFVCWSADLVILIKTEAPAVLAIQNFQMNMSKTECTIVQRSSTARSNRITRTKDEDWRKTRNLGFLLGDAEEVSRYMRYSESALHRM